MASGQAGLYSTFAPFLLLFLQEEFVSFSLVVGFQFLEITLLVFLCFIQIPLQCGQDTTYQFFCSFTLNTAPLYKCLQENTQSILPSPWCTQAKPCSWCTQTKPCPLHRETIPVFHAVEALTTLLPAVLWSQRRSGPGCQLEPSLSDHSESEHSQSEVAWEHWCLAPFSSSYLWANHSCASERYSGAMCKLQSNNLFNSKVSHQTGTVHFLVWEAEQTISLLRHHLNSTVKNTTVYRYTLLTSCVSGCTPSAAGGVLVLPSWSPNRDTAGRENKTHIILCRWVCVQILHFTNLIRLTVMLDFLWVNNRAFGAQRAFILCYFKHITQTRFEQRYL